jgi:hypothetical protein
LHNLPQQLPRHQPQPQQAVLLLLLLLLLMLLVLPTTWGPWGQAAVQVLRMCIVMHSAFLSALTCLK